MKKLLKGNQAIAYAAAQANAKVIPVFPITPQTSIIETLADLVKEGKCDAAYIPMESEHSVMAACIGAANTGVRTFTATSGQGLLYMHELLHWASGGRLPIVMGVVNRAVAPGWNIWMDQSDTISQRDTGWMQIYTSNHQEVYDHLFIAYKLSEKVLLPSMVIQDAFFLSHTMGELDIAENAKVAQFLPELPDLPFAFNFDAPKTLGPLSSPENYMDFRKKIQDAFEETKELLPQIYSDFEQIFGRKYELFESYLTDDAEIIVFLSGTVFETAYGAIDKLRKEGIKVGTVKVRFLRPFFENETRELAKNRKQVIVIDRNCSFGKGGVFADEVKSALQGLDLPVTPIIAGLGGRDITENTLISMLNKAISLDNKSESLWEGEVNV